MSSHDLFAWLGGAGGSAIVIALIQWARSHGSDQATVAERWESGVSTLLGLAEERTKQLNADLQVMRTTAADLSRELETCKKQCRELHDCLDDALKDLEQHHGDAEPYRERVAHLRSI